MVLPLKFTLEARYVQVLNMSPLLQPSAMLNLELSCQFRSNPIWEPWNAACACPPPDSMVSEIPKSIVEQIFFRLKYVIGTLLSHPLFVIIAQDKGKKYQNGAKNITDWLKGVKAELCKLYNQQTK